MRQKKIKWKAFFFLRVIFYSGRKVVFTLTSFKGSKLVVDMPQLSTPHVYQNLQTEIWSWTNKFPVLINTCIFKSTLTQLQITFALCLSCNNLHREYGKQPAHNCHLLSLAAPISLPFNSCPWWNYSNQAGREESRCGGWRHGLLPKL